MILESTVFGNGGSIPRRYTCDGEDVSPPLTWRDARRARARRGHAHGAVREVLTVSAPMRSARFLFAPRAA